MAKQLSKEDLLEIKLLEEQLAHAETTIKYLVTEGNRVTALRDALKATRQATVEKLQKKYELVEGDRIDSDGNVISAESPETPPAA